MTEETQPDSNTMAPHRVEAFTEVHSSIKGLHNDISNALNLSVIKRNFDEHASNLRQKEEKLLETVKKLELTKETLVEEVHHREAEELNLDKQIRELRVQRDEITSRLTGFEHDKQGIQAEKVKLDSLLTRMRGVLSEMRGKVGEFENILKAE
tara:strand:- start:811 stop:1269 length:459 start_codon:yes stop_codon:yes gene_type:complete